MPTLGVMTDVFEIVAEGTYFTPGCPACDWWCSGLGCLAYSRPYSMWQCTRMQSWLFCIDLYPAYILTNKMWPPISLVLPSGGWRPVWSLWCSVSRCPVFWKIHTLIFLRFGNHGFPMQSPFFTQFVRPAYDYLPRCSRNPRGPSSFLFFSWLLFLPLFSLFLLFLVSFYLCLSGIGHPVGS